MEGHGAEREPGEEAPGAVFHVCPVSQMLLHGGRSRRERQQQLCSKACMGNLTSLSR